jgi:hypothetical protein
MSTYEEENAHLLKLSLSDRRKVDTAVDKTLQFVKTQLIVCSSPKTSYGYLIEVSELLRTLAALNHETRP